MNFFISLSLLKYKGGKCMKKFIFLAGLAFMFTGVQAFAAPPHHHGRPHNGRPPIHGGISHHRPPIYHVRYVRPMPVYRPYYTNYYYYSTPTYTYYSYEPGYGQTVVVRENYSGINTAANVINAAANVATAIRLLTW